MQIQSIVALAALASGAAAVNCRNITVPVTISARTGIFNNLAVPTTNLEVTDLILNITKQGGNFTNTALTGYNTTSGTYNISAQYCTPTNTTNSAPVLQVLTHGIGFDKSYWNLPYNNYNYSYVHVAADRYGYSTLAYDRLGIGASSHGEPVNEIQSFLEVAALAQMTRMLRNGTFPQVNTTFSKIVHVGHSFGSAQTYALVNQYPTISDGIILTGFSMNATFVPFFAAGANFQLASRNQPLRFGSFNAATIQNLLNMYAEPLADYITPALSNLPVSHNLSNGYLISSNAEAAKYLFLKSHFYPPGLLTVAEQTKQPVTVGELLTLGSLSMMNAYAGPVMVIAGDSDLPYCGGDCVATGNASLPSIPAAVAKNFPNVAMANFTAYIQPNTGHGMNMHYNATGGYNVINNFLRGKGL